MARPIDAAEVEASYADLADRRGGTRPYVVVNMVASADGATAVEGRTRALSTPADRAVFHYLRSLADVILVGAQTARAEGYGPPRLPQGRQEERLRRGQEALPRIAVVTASLQLDWSSPLFADPARRPLLLVPNRADGNRLCQAEAVADVVTVGDGRVDLADALRALAGRGAGTVLCEGGPTLNGELARGDLIDELCLTVAPSLVGGDVVTGLLAHQRLPGLLGLILVHALEDQGQLFLRYRRDAGTWAPTTGDTRGTTATVPLAAAVKVAQDDAFQEIVADIDYPMLIVTAADGAEVSGCLVGFAAQASIEPPRFVVWISKKNHTYRIARAARALGVHLPSSRQRRLAELFGTLTGDEVDKFAECRWKPGPLGTPIIDDVERWFVGQVTEAIDSGDHVAFVLAPVAGQAGGDWVGQLGFQSVKDLTPGHRA